eukprot:TRINITY_DN2516_c0_g1_i1.p1 TRINITY_DN2516_c0_g1~~TRINITY_DN2516_c0_g1_i1.p1  ORF type:complete len:588 (-),score=50.76 TRINITY_DN2516_c0_g1_i1:549-2312(-)
MQRALRMSLFALPALIVGTSMESSVLLELHVIDSRRAGSSGSFDVLFLPILNMWEPLKPATGNLARNTWHAQKFQRSGDPPTSLALRAHGKDGLGIDKIKVNGVEIRSNLPRWLDSPCEVIANATSIPCATQCTWMLPQLTTTRSTTTFSATTATLTETSVTATMTSTSATSSTATLTETSLTATMTSTSATSSKTISTTATTMPTITGTMTKSLAIMTDMIETRSYTEEAVSQQGSIAEEIHRALVPQLFYDEFTAVMDLRANHARIAGGFNISDLTTKVAHTVGDFVGLHAPSSVHCQIDVRGNNSAKAILVFRIFPQSPVPAVDIRAILVDREKTDELNKLLAGIYPNLQASEQVHNSEFVDSANEHPQCDVGSFLCCIRLVVHSIVANAGVIESYRDNFVWSMILILFLILISAQTGLARILGKCGRHASEYGMGETQRRRLVMALFALGALSEAGLSVFMSIEKYRWVASSRAVGEPPPSPLPMVTEAAIVGLLPIGFLLVFICLVNSSSAEDIPAGVELHLEGEMDRRCSHDDRSDDGRVWRPVTPLESLIRRSYLLAAWKVGVRISSRTRLSFGCQCMTF